ncbi:MAG: hypothetical protein JW774_07300 [Candidatus Aureabacteria bacterium]|nr:hypothetical protein [Candidatus Auribacterota bacterium]
MKRSLGLGLFFFLIWTGSVYCQEAETKEETTPTSQPEIRTFNAPGKGSQPLFVQQTTPVQMGEQQRPMTPPAPFFEELNQISDEEALNFLKENNPPQYENIIKIKDTDSDDYQRQIQRAKFLCYRRNRMKKNHPEMYARNERMRKNNNQLKELRKQYTEEKDENKKQEIKKEILQILSDEFDMQQETMKENLEKMRKGLEDQEKKVKENEEKKDELIEKRFDQMLTFNNTNTPNMKPSPFIRPPSEANGPRPTTRLTAEPESKK